MGINDSLKVRLTVTNTGSREGEEIVQLYVRDLVGSVTRPVKELKGFQKVKIAAGQSVPVEFTLSTHDLRFYTQDMQFKAEPGDFQVMTGPNSADVQTAAFVLK